MSIESWLPPTALVALLLFIAREIFDYFKKKRADDRKIKALKIFLARECELIKWTIMKLEQAAKNTKEIEEDYKPLVFEKKGGKSFRVTQYRRDGREYISYVVNDVDLLAFGKYYLDIAAIDDEFFKNYDEANNAAASVKHVLDSFLDLEKSAQVHNPESFMLTFSQYAEFELEEAKKTLKEFYKYCTEQDEFPHRLR